MNNSKISELNAFAKVLGVDDCVKFYESDVFDIVTAVAPFARVAVLYEKASFEEFGKELTNKLKVAGVKPLNFIMPNGVTVKLDEVLDVICVPEDVRAVVCFDRKIISVAAYIATIFNIPVVYGMRDSITDGVLPAFVPFSFGGSGAETVSVTCNYHVAIIFDKLTEENIAEEYAWLISNLIDLVDYRAKVKICGGNINKSVCDEISVAVNEILEEPKTKDELAFHGLKVQIAHLALNGEILRNSALYSFKRLTGFNETEGLTFTLLKKLIALYTLCAKNQDMPFIVPDYNKRVEELSRITNLDDGVFLKNLIAQKTALKIADLSNVKSAIKKELSGINLAFNKAEKTYIALGGKIIENFSPYVKALKHCGDMTGTVNFMSVVRECGFAEFN